MIYRWLHLPRLNIGADSGPGIRTPKTSTVDAGVIS